MLSVSLSLNSYEVSCYISKPQGEIRTHPSTLTLLRRPTPPRALMDAFAPVAAVRGDGPEAGGGLFGTSMFGGFKPSPPGGPAQAR